MNPLGVAGYPIDPETLTPDFARNEERRADKERRARDKIADAQEVVNELSDDRGLIVREAIQLFVRRVESLIVNDPECQVYENIFKSIGLKLQAADAITKNRVLFFLK